MSIGRGLHPEQGLRASATPTHRRRTCASLPRRLAQDLLPLRPNRLPDTAPPSSRQSSPCRRPSPSESADFPHRSPREPRFLETPSAWRLLAGSKGGGVGAIRRSDAILGVRPREVNEGAAAL